MKTSNLLEKAKPSKEKLRENAGDVLISVNKFHGDLIESKPSDIKIPAKLEDMLYGLSAELDKFVEKTR